MTYRELSSGSDVMGSADQFCSPISPFVEDKDKNPANTAETVISRLLRSCICQQRTYGVNCKELCICQWNNTISCDGVSGACWCKRGWIGVACQTECPPGFFGFDCGNECNCSTNQTCDSETGDCACTTGYTGVYCTERIVPLAKTQDDLPDYLLIVIQVILAVIVLVVILAFIIHFVRKKNLRKSHNCTEGSVTGNTNTILADYYSNLSVKELQKKRKQPGHHSPRRSKAPNGSLYTEVDRPNEPKQRLAPYQDSSVIFIKRTSIKDNGTGSIIENADKDHCLGSDDSSQVTAYVNEALNKEDAYDELGKDRHVTDAIPGKDQYDHMKLNQNKAGNGDDVYDKLEQRSRDKNVNDIDDTYDHTQHVSDK
ncbi:platelet endothelial aggregation receptor 1-like [Mizuhopecten yessoensis]|uniref:platelet endothelial aggregation receptor 1-like n=1 Tax=Mizuhopecten yessoensis TaxID=6573 RepID=UPI000B4598C0|nr:platelet endothelial aggregation receptor 1-like [Mizuhopecten yessoensis]